LLSVWQDDSLLGYVVLVELAERVNRLYERMRADEKRVAAILLRVGGGDRRKP
jgi:hypothetical protein